MLSVELIVRKYGRGKWFANKSVMGSVGAEDLGDSVCGEFADLCVRLLAF